MRNIKVVGLLCVGLLVCCRGCGTELSSFLEDVEVPEHLLTVCEGVMDEGEINAALLTATLDNINGYSKDEEFTAATEGCLSDAGSEEFTFEECLSCKSAILDVVFGS